MEENTLSLPIDEVSAVFEQHLNISTNKRILFSGRFGSGKTYFLKEFFRKEAYSAIHIHPVNYSVSQNKDIFELVKFDILFELLQFELEFDYEEFSYLLTSEYYLSNNKLEVLKFLVQTISKLGKNISDIIEEIEKVIKKTKEYHKEVNQDDLKEIIVYLKKFAQEKGSPYEEDHFTNIIRKQVEKLKASERQTVLIIDDLDRMDPEHIFRILNVFAAHFDIRYNNNKFNFDKVIIVCDELNLREIFHTKYGGSADFSGYIDKFFSLEVFKFNNNNNIVKYIPQLLNRVKISKGFQLRFDFYNPRSFYTYTINYIIKIFVKCNAINIRSLVKLNETDYFPYQYDIPIDPIKKAVMNYQFALIPTLDFLVFVLGSSKSLKDAIDKAAIANNIEKVIDPHDYSNKQKINDVMAIIIGVHSNFISTHGSDILIKIGDEKININYSYEGGDNRNGEYICKVNSISNFKGEEIKFENINYFELLRLAYDILTKDFGIHM